MQRLTFITNIQADEGLVLVEFVPLVIPGFGECWCFGQVNRLLQRPLQMSHPLLDHLPDVLNPFLFGLHTGGLYVHDGCVFQIISYTLKFLKFLMMCIYIYI